MCNHQSVPLLAVLNGWPHILIPYLLQRCLTHREVPDVEGCFAAFQETKYICYPSCRDGDMVLHHPEMPILRGQEWWGKAKSQQIQQLDHERMKGQGLWCLLNVTVW